MKLLWLVCVLWMAQTLGVSIDKPTDCEWVDDDCEIDMPGREWNCFAGAIIDDWKPCTSLCDRNDGTYSKACTGYCREYLHRCNTASKKPTVRHITNRLNKTVTATTIETTTPDAAVHMMTRTTDTTDTAGTTGSTNSAGTTGTTSGTGTTGRTGTPGTTGTTPNPTTPTTPSASNSGTVSVVDTSGPSSTATSTNTHATTKILRMIQRRVTNTTDDDKTASNTPVLGHPPPLDSHPIPYNVLFVLFAFCALLNIIQGHQRIFNGLRTIWNSLRPSTRVGRINGGLMPESYAAAPVTPALRGNVVYNGEDNIELGATGKADGEDSSLLSAPQVS